MKLLRASALLVCAMGFAVACGQADQSGGESTTPAPADIPAAAVGATSFTIAVDGMT